jgi:TolB protein
MRSIKIPFLLLTILTISRVAAQEVYLRLTDYGGGKIDLVMGPLTTREVSSELLTKLGNIKYILRQDLEYSLYFDIFTDTTALSDLPDIRGIMLRGNYSKSILTIFLEDLKSNEKISSRAYQIDGEIRTTAHRIADDVIEILTGEKGIASTKIAFAYKKGVGKELALIDYDGFNLLPLTDNRNINIFPAWSPDGKKILFSNYSADRLNLNILEIASRAITPLSSFQGLNFAPYWSPDGAKICLSLTKDGNAEIYLLDLKTKNMNRLTNNRAIDTSPCFSPNSREIAFVSDRSGNPQIYVMDIYGGNVRRLTFHGDYNTSPAWSPRGDIIAYVSREKDNSQQIYVTDPYDFNPVRVTYWGNNEEPSWSPDGLHMVFISDRSGQYELYTMNWDGSRQRKLTTDLAAYNPDWSPIFK